MILLYSSEQAERMRSQMNEMQAKHQQDLLAAQDAHRRELIEARQLLTLSQYLDQIHPAARVGLDASPRKVFPASRVGRAGGTASTREQPRAVSRIVDHREALDAEGADAGVEAQTSHRMKPVAGRRQMDGGAGVPVPNHAQNMEQIPVVVSRIRLAQGPPQRVDLPQVHVGGHPAIGEDVQDRRPTKPDQSAVLR